MIGASIGNSEHAARPAIRISHWCAIKFATYFRHFQQPKSPVHLETIGEAQAFLASENSWSSCIENEVLGLLLELCLKVLRALAVATARSTNVRGSNPPQILYNAVRPSAQPFRMLNLCGTKALNNIVLVWLLLDRVNLW